MCVCASGRDSEDATAFSPACYLFGRKNDSVCLQVEEEKQGGGPVGLDRRTRQPPQLP